MTVIWVNEWVVPSRVSEDEPGGGIWWWSIIQAVIRGSRALCCGCERKVGKGLIIPLLLRRQRNLDKQRRLLLDRLSCTWRVWKICLLLNFILLILVGRLPVLGQRCGIKKCLWLPEHRFFLTFTILHFNSACLFCQFSPAHRYSNCRLSDNFPAIASSPRAKWILPSCSALCITGAKGLEKAQNISILNSTFPLSMDV